MQCPIPENLPWTPGQYILPNGGNLADFADWPWRLPTVDAYLVERVPFGKRDLEIYLGDFALQDEVGERTEGEGPCPTGMGPCPGSCRSIRVWGLSEKCRLEELFKWCRDFGDVECSEVVKPEGSWERAYAQITFAQSSAAQTSLCCLHRMRLDGEARGTRFGMSALQIVPRQRCPFNSLGMCLL
jgi:hypothetical protein